MKKNQKGFTLIELLVVIAIIGLLSAGAVVALNSARSKSRDAKRITDIKQIQTALELYFNDKTGYPPASTSIILGDPSYKTLSSVGFTATSSASGTIYMPQVPSSPISVDGSCTTENNKYTYTSTASSTYTLKYCLGGTTGGVEAGPQTACEGGLSGCQ